MSRSSDKPDVLQGTLDLLILHILSLTPLHGYAIAQRLSQVSNDLLQVHQGSLYPALYRLEKRGWLRSAWGMAESGREARFYTLTASGRKRLNVERSQWNRMSQAIALVLKTAN